MIGVVITLNGRSQNRELFFSLKIGFIKSTFAGYCIMMLGNIKHDANNKGPGNSTIDPLTVTQWSILGVCLFFCTGHWFVVYSIQTFPYLFHCPSQWLCWFVNIFGFWLINIYF